MSRFDAGRVIRARIRQQSAAEFALSDAIDADGIDYETFLQTHSLTAHEFNLLAHLFHGVHDTLPSPNVVAAAQYLKWKSGNVIVDATFRSEDRFKIAL